jgi:hypothetical protein
LRELLRRFNGRRAAVLVLGAVIVGAAAGALTYLSSRSLASAVFTGAGAFAAALLCCGPRSASDADRGDA